MTSPLLLLAQEGASTSARGGGNSSPFMGNIFDNLNILSRPDELLDALGRMPFIGAATIVTVGILCVFNGYRWHKWVVAVLAFLCGIGLGYVLSQQMGKSLIVAASVGGLFAIIATPLLRVTVAIFGGITGAFIGANTWTAVHANPADAHWAGAIIGFIIVAMASLVMFRLVVVLFTSVGGAAMVIAGSITLLMQVPGWQPSIRQGLTDNQTIIPLLLLLAAVSGFVIQQSSMRTHGLRITANDSKTKDE